jgi:hypothetical protein
LRDHDSGNAGEPAWTAAQGQRSGRRGDRRKPWIGGDQDLKASGNVSLGVDAAADACIR